MSKDAGVLGVASERNRDGPDYFGYYRCQVAELLSQDGGGFGGVVRRGVGIERSFTVSDSLFSNVIGTALTEFKRERLKAMLGQGVIVLSTEADEIMCPVIKTSGLLTQRRNKMLLWGLTGPESEEDAGQARKKFKVTPSSSATSRSQLSSPTDPALSVRPKNFARLHDAETAKGTTGPKQSRVNDDVELLLEDDSSELDKIMMKFSDELYSKLEHMEQELEELLDVVMSSCRPMTLAEKKQLQKMIKGLPPKNLDRIAELVQRGKPAEERSCDQIFVDLEKESNATLWRLYYYVEAVEKAKKLCL